MKNGRALNFVVDRRGVPGQRRSIGLRSSADQAWQVKIVDSGAQAHRELMGLGSRDHYADTNLLDVRKNPGPQPLNPRLYLRALRTAL
jgi:hypothetical protein